MQVVVVGLGAEPRLRGGGGPRAVLLARAEHALVAALARVAALLLVAHVAVLRGGARAAALLFRRGRRLGGGHDAVLGVVRLHPEAALGLAPVLRSGLETLVIALVAVTVAAAGLIRRRRRRRLRREHGRLADGLLARHPEALHHALALVAGQLLDAVVELLLAHVRVAAARLLGRGRRRRGGRLRRRGDDAVIRVVGEHPVAALALALALLRRLEALVVALVAVAVAAAGRHRRRLGGGGPHLLAVLVLAERLPVAAIVAIVVGEHQAVALGEEGLARSHPARRVGRVGVAVAAARLGRRLRGAEVALVVERAALDPVARGHAVARLAVQLAVALLIRLERVALAAALGLALVLRGGLETLVVALVAVAVAAAGQHS